MKMNSDIAIPLYQQLYDILREQIEEGVYPAGSRIPSEEELCKTYNLSRVTVRNALGRMVDDNILVKKHGKGTFVATPVFTESAYAKGSFTKSCLQMGTTPTTRVVSRKFIKAGKMLAKQLQTEDGKRAVCIKRIRCTNDVAAIFEVDYFTEDFEFMMEADVETRPVLDVITEHCGLTSRQYIDTFEVHFAGKEQASWLQCPVNTPLLKVSQVVLNEMRGVLYYNEQYIRSDIYKYVVGS